MPVPANTRTTIVPSMHYRDAPAAIEWLCRAFGFEKHLIVPDDNGGIRHAQLTFGNGMIMLSSSNQGEWGRRMALPAEIGGRETQCCCLTVSDPDAHYAQAQTAGAEIIDALTAREYGGKGYGCRDPEGHIWWIGNYDPWSD